MIQRAILDMVDNISLSQETAEIEVLLSLADTYIKEYQVDCNDECIIEESAKEKSDNSKNNGKPGNILKPVMPRLKLSKPYATIVKVIELIKNIFKRIMNLISKTILKSKFSKLSKMYKDDDEVLSIYKDEEAFNKTEETLKSETESANKACDSFKHPGGIIRMIAILFDSDFIPKVSEASISGTSHMYTYAKTTINNNSGIKLSVKTKEDLDNFIDANTDNTKIMFGNLKKHVNTVFLPYIKSMTKFSKYWCEFMDSIIHNWEDVNAEKLAAGRPNFTRIIIFASIITDYRSRNSVVTGSVLKSVWETAGRYTINLQKEYKVRADFDEYLKMSGNILSSLSRMIQGYAGWFNALIMMKESVPEKKSDDKDVIDVQQDQPAGKPKALPYVH